MATSSNLTLDLTLSKLKYDIFTRYSIVGLGAYLAVSLLAFHRMNKQKNRKRTV
jgi:hypothetical protein